MGHREMRRFRFDGTSLQQIHGWMHGGAGIRGIATAVENLQGMAEDLKESQASLRRALQEIGVGWEGTAATGADGSVNESETWTVEATPVVADSTASTRSVGYDFQATRSRMPTPQEAELTTLEHVVASSVPIVGPVVDRALADAKLDRVTNEARQRMEEWQTSANASVGSVQPLPPVPQPVVDAAPTQAAATQTVSPPGGGRPVAVTPTVPGPAVGGGGPSGFGGSPVPPPVQPPGGFPSSPPVSPSPIGQPPVQPIAPGRPAGGPGVLPMPIGGIGPTGTAEGRRRAFGPGMYSADEISRARGGAGAAAKGGAAADGPESGSRPTGRTAGGALAPGGAARGAAAEGGVGRGSAGRGAGSLMQPAIGAGASGEDDLEHSDKYADKTDEHFTDGIQRVAPPVIGG